MRSLLIVMAALAALALAPTALADDEHRADRAEDARDGQPASSNSPPPAGVVFGPPDPGNGCRPTC